MAGYGRLEVFFPDGIHKSFVLTEDNVSVGRQPGNVIPLDTETISRYHLSITHKDGETFITDLDSANGTFVDGVRLKHDEHFQLAGGEEILIGDLRLFYYGVDELSTRPNLPPVDETPHVSADQATFHIEMDEPDIAVPPGAHTSAELRITNRGSMSERFVIEVTGVPRDWLRIDRAEFDLRPDDVAYVQISFKPTRKPGSAPGDYPITVTVRHKEEPAQALQAVVTLHVLPFGGFGMALEKRLLVPEQPFRVHLHNQGSADLALALSATDPSGKLRISLMPERAILKPDQRLVVNGTAAPRRRRLTGSPQRYPFDIVVRSNDAASYTVAQRAYVTETPSLPGWLVPALVALVVLLVVGGVAVLVLATRPSAPPTINGFAVQPASVPAGQDLQAAWDAEGADTIVLSVNGAVVQTLDGDASQASVSTGGLVGPVSVVLQASNNGGDVSAEATANVVPPLTVAAFNADSPTLVRHVVQPITFAWSAPGAARVRLYGTEVLTTTPIDESLPAEGSLTVTAYLISPEPEVLLTILAEDASGQTVQQSLSLPVSDPLCTAPQETSLFDSPVPGGRVISTVPAGTAVVVDARNADATWLRVRLGLGGVRGWGEAAAFECEPTFDVHGLQPDPTIPLVTPSPVPTLRPTASPAAATPAAVTPTAGVTIEAGAAATPTESSGARG